MEKIIKALIFLIVIAGLFAYLGGKRSSLSGDESQGWGYDFSALNPLNILKGDFPRGTSITETRSSISSPVSGITSGTSGSVSGQSPSAASSISAGYSLPQGFKESDISPYYKKVKISWISANSYDNKFQIQLRSPLASGEQINITGWRIKGRYGEIYIPRAIKDYNPWGNYREENIVVSMNGSVYIYSWGSPISGFELNKCSGYLENNNDFEPSLPRNCPAPYAKEEMKSLVGYCQDYISSLGRCRLPDVKYYNSLPGNDDGNACREYLGKISYQSCYNRHSGGADFLSNDWRIWLNRTWTYRNILDPRHDVVRLFDSQGLLVDEYSY